MLKGIFVMYSNAKDKNEWIRQQLSYNEKVDKCDGLDWFDSGYRLLYPKLNSTSRRGSRVI